MGKGRRRSSATVSCKERSSWGSRCRRRVSDCELSRVARRASSQFEVQASAQRPVSHNHQTRHAAADLGGGDDGRRASHKDGEAGAARGGPLRLPRAGRCHCSLPIMQLQQGARAGHGRAGRAAAHGRGGAVLGGAVLGGAVAEVPAPFVQGRQANRGRGGGRAVWGDFADIAYMYSRARAHVLYYPVGRAEPRGRIWRVG